MTRSVAVWTLVAASVIASLGSQSIPVASDVTLVANVWTIPPALGLVVVGALIVLRRPGNLVGWMLAVAGAAFSVSIWTERYVAYAHIIAGDSPPTAVWALWLEQWVWALIIAPLFVFVPLLFPDGHVPSRRWRPVAWSAGLLVLTQIVTGALRPGPMLSQTLGPLWENPVGIGAVGPYADTIVTVSEVTFLPVFLLVVIAPIVRWRRSRGIERQQMKWFLASVALLAGFAPLAFLGVLPDLLGTVMFSLVILAVPVAIGMAVLRYRLYDIDRIVSRTVSYALVTMVLVGIYAVGVVGVGQLLRGLTGEGGGDLLVAASTLAVAAAFRPVRSRVQSAVDRRFNRSRYDAQRTVESFTQRLRDEVDVDALTEDVAGVAANALHPAHVKVWLATSAVET